MLTRTAIYEGSIKAGREEEFYRRVRDELEPMWRRFPNVMAVRVQRTTTADKDCPPIAMILEMDFEDMKAIEDCMASNIRPESHAATEKSHAALRRALLPPRSRGDGARTERLKFIPRPEIDAAAAHGTLWASNPVAMG